MNKKTTIWVIVIILVVAGIGAYFLFRPGSQEVSKITPTPSQQDQPQNQNPPAQTPPVDNSKTVIGKSSGGRDITAYHYGSGSKEILFVGGIHGGYEWNTSLVAYQLMDYLKSNPNAVPAQVKVTVVPVLNPDGLSKVANPDSFTAADVTASQEVQISGRYNAKGVDLNRNFDCDWKAQGVWQDKTVSGGTAPFSEPESQAIKAYTDAHKPAAVVAWYSSAGGVFSSNCHAGVLAETKSITDIFARAAGYPAHASYDFYAINGDMMNWFAKNSVPAISVLLTNHTDTEWAKNKAGIDALLQYFGK